MGKRIFIFSLVLLATSVVVSGQAFKKKSKWFRGQGKVWLLDGKVLEGEIYYSFQHSTVQVIKDNRSSQFKSDKVSYFQYFDEGFVKHRRFYSIPYDLDQNNYVETVFFEVLLELKTIALLKTQLYKDFDLTTGNFERLTEVLYFADNKGKITPYVEVVHKMSGPSRKLIDKNGLTAVTKSSTYKVQNFIKQERLNQKKEEDLIKILMYFDKIK